MYYSRGKATTPYTDMYNVLIFLMTALAAHNCHTIPPASYVQGVIVITAAAIMKGTKVQTLGASAVAGAWTVHGWLIGQ